MGATQRWQALGSSLQLLATAAQSAGTSVVLGVLALGYWYDVYFES